MSSCWRHLTRQMFDIYGFTDKLCCLCTHFHARDASGTMEPLFVRPDSAFILRDLWKDESELVFLQCNLSPWTGLRLLLCYMTRHFFLPAGDWISTEQLNKISSTSLAPFWAFCSLKWLCSLSCSHFSKATDWTNNPALHWCAKITSS